MQWVETENDKLLTRISKWHHMTSWSSEPCHILLVSKGFCTSLTLISIWLSRPSAMFSRFVATNCRNILRQIKFKVCVVVTNQEIPLSHNYTSDWLVSGFYWKLFRFLCWVHVMDQLSWRYVRHHQVLLRHICYLVQCHNQRWYENYNYLVVIKAINVKQFR